MGHNPDREVLAFGSRAMWTARGNSDLDLAIMGEEPLSLRVFCDLEETLDESDLPFRVDLINWAWTEEYFRAIIRRDCVVVQTPAIRSNTASRESPAVEVRALPGDWRESKWGDEISLEYG